MSALSCNNKSAHRGNSRCRIGNNGEIRGVRNTREDRIYGHAGIKLLGAFDLVAASVAFGVPFLKDFSFGSVGSLGHYKFAVHGFNNQLFIADNRIVFKLCFGVCMDDYVLGPQLSFGGDFFSFTADLGKPAHKIGVLRRGKIGQLDMSEVSF